MGKITRSRNGCLTCKQRRRKCDEGKPECQNCVKSGRTCGGYGIRLVFDVDDSRNKANRNSTNSKGEKKYGFRGRPRLRDSLAKALPAETGSSSSTNSNIPQVQQEDAQSKQVKDVPASTQNIIPDHPQQQKPLPGNDITNPFQFENALYDGLDYLLNSSSDMNIFSASTTEGIPANFQMNPQQQQLLDLIEFQSAANNTNKLSHYSQPLDNSIAQMPSPRFPLTPKFTIQSPLLIAKTPIDKQHDSSIPNVRVVRSPSTATTTSVASVKAPENKHPKAISVSPDTIPTDNDQSHTDDADSNPSSTSIYAPSPFPTQNTTGNSEENYILKHFFDKLIYLLDAHPQTPWPDLMMKFGSFELAKSCFLSLSSIHLYVNNGGNEFYKKGILHINNTMEYLIKYVKNKDVSKKDDNKPKEGSSTDKYPIKVEDDNSVEADSSQPAKEEQQKNAQLNVESIVTNLKTESTKRKQTNFFVILLLLYVHLLFAVLESGRTALSRLFLKLFASIAEDQTFKSVLNRIDQSQGLICALSWFDTISAIVSPDCRLPFCKVEWYGTKKDLISTAKMNGCPGEIFAILYELCKLRHSLGGNNINDALEKPNCEITEIDLNCSFENLKSRIMNYRDYVPLELPNSFSYEERLKSAQCWSISTYIKLLEVTQLDKDFREEIDKLILEFFSVYETLNSQSPIVTQMVWPVLNIGINCRSPESRFKIMKCMDTLYDTVKMGTIKTIVRVTEEVWETGLSLDEILKGKEWLGAGIDFLPC